MKYVQLKFMNEKREIMIWNECLKSYQPRFPKMIKDMESAKIKKVYESPNRINLNKITSRPLLILL